MYIKNIIQILVIFIYSDNDTTYTCTYYTCYNYI